DAALAGAEDPAGDALLVGAGRRAAVLFGTELRAVGDPPSDVHAVAPLRDGQWIGLTANALVQFDGVAWTVIAELEMTGHHGLALSDHTIVYTPTRDSVLIAELAEVTKPAVRVGYTDCYFNGGPLTIVGLARAGERTIIGLNRNNANLVHAAGIGRL